VRYLLCQWKVAEGSYILASYHHMGALEQKNAIVFRNVASMPMMVLSIIKSSAGLWGIAGAKYLSALMPRE
jgi:hypothetical protein